MWNGLGSRAMARTNTSSDPGGQDGAGSCRRAFDRHGVADAWFRQSLEMLEAIQSRPEVGQTLLAYGRLLTREDKAAERALIGPGAPQPRRGKGLADTVAR